MIGSHALGKMKEKRSKQQGTKLVQPRLHLVGKGWNLWYALQELQTESCTGCYVHVRSKMAIRSPLNTKSAKSVKLRVVLMDLLCLILLHEPPLPPPVRMTLRLATCFAMFSPDLSRCSELMNVL